MTTIPSPNCYSFNGEYSPAWTPVTQTITELSTHNCKMFSEGACECRVISFPPACWCSEICNVIGEENSEDNGILDDSG